MPEDFFRQGKLEMATEAFQAGPQVMLWGDCLANRIAVVALLLLMLIELADFLRTVPKIWDCVQMWRANIGLEHSISTARSRNNAAITVALGWILVADRYGIYPAAWIDSLAYGWSAAALLGVVIAYPLLRRIALLLCAPKRMHGDDLHALHKAMFTYFIPSGLIMMLTAGAMSVAGCRDALVCMVLQYELLVFWLFAIIRTAQILSSKQSILATILYLCGLEFLPAGAVVATAVLL